MSGDSSLDYYSEEDTQFDPPNELNMASPLDLLQSVFTDYDKDYLLQLLTDNQFDLSYTVEQLIGISNEDEEALFSGLLEGEEEQGVTAAHNFNTSSQQAPKSTPPAKDLQVCTTYSMANTDITQPVCKYYLQGSCLVRNCPYRHTSAGMKCRLTTTENDLSVVIVVCKYWLQGYCSRGDSCVYLHALDADTLSTQINQLQLGTVSVQQNNKPATSTTNTLSQTEFPALGREEFPTLVREEADTSAKNNKKKKKKKGKSSANNTTPIQPETAQPPVQPLSTTPSKKADNKIDLGNNGPVDNWNKHGMDVAAKIKLKQLQEKFHHVKVCILLSYSSKYSI